MFRQLILICVLCACVVGCLFGLVNLYPQTLFFVSITSIAMLIGVHHYFLQGVPVHREKRTILHLSLALVLLGLLSIFISDGNISFAIVIPMVLLLSLYGIQMLIIRKYLALEPRVLSEMFLLQSVIAMGLVVTEYWMWGQDQQVPLLLLKFLTLGTVSIIVLITSSVVKRIASYISVFIVLVMGIFKILTQPTIGPEFFFYIGLFAYYVGFIVDWIMTTTVAERKLSQNISATTVWVITVIAGIILLLIA